MNRASETSETITKDVTFLSLKSPRDRKREHRAERRNNV